MNLDLRIITRLWLGLILGLYFSASHSKAEIVLPKYVALCTALFAETNFVFGVTKPAPVEGLFSATWQGRLKIRAQIRAKNSELLEQQREFLKLQTACLSDSEYDSERISLIYNNAKKDSADYEVKSKFRAPEDPPRSPVFFEMQKLYEAVRIAISNSVTIKEIEFYRNFLISELKRISDLHHQAIAQRLNVISELKDFVSKNKRDFAGYFNADVAQRLKDDIAKLRLESPLEDLIQASERIRRNLTESISEWKAKETARKQAENRFDLEQAGNEQPLWQAYESNLRNHGLTSLTSAIGTNSGVLIERMQQYPPLKAFIYREMRLLKLSNTKSPTADSLTLRTANNVRLLLSWADADPKSISKAEASLKLLSTFREFLGAKASLQPLREALPFLSFRKWPPNAREKIIAEAFKNPILISVMMNLQVEIPQNPEPPSHPREPEFPELLNHSFVTELAGKSSRGIHFVVNSVKAEIEKYRLAHAKYVEDLKLVPQRRIEYKARLKLLQDMQLRKETAEQTWLAYLVFQFPEVFKSPEDGYDYSSPLQKYVTQVLKQRLVRLRKKGKQLYLSPSAEAPNWKLFALVANPMWIFSPDFAQYQLYFDLQPTTSSPSLQIESLFTAQRILYFEGLSATEIDQNRDQFAKVNREIIALGKRSLHENSADLSLKSVRDFLIQISSREIYESLSDTEEERAPQRPEPDSAARIAAEAHIAAETEIARAREEALSEVVTAEREANAAQAAALAKISQASETLQRAADEAEQVLRRKAPVINVDFPGEI